jgi:hypothetical protein
MFVPEDHVWPSHRGRCAADGEDHDGARDRQSPRPQRERFFLLPADAFGVTFVAASLQRSLIFARQAGEGRAIEIANFRSLIRTSDAICSVCLCEMRTRALRRSRRRGIQCCASLKPNARQRSEQRHPSFLGEVVLSREAWERASAISQKTRARTRASRSNHRIVFRA